MPTQKPRITDPRFLIIPEIKKTDGRTLDCTGFPEKRIAKRSCSWYNPQCARSNIGMSPSGKAPDFDSGIRRFKSGHPSQHDPLAQLAEQLPFKQWVRGSNPRRVTKRKTTPCGWFSFWSVRGDSNPLQCRCPVDTCAHQCKHWWELSYDRIPGGRTKRSPAGGFPFGQS